MPRPGALVRAALTGAAAVVLLTACGGSGANNNASSSSSTSAHTTSAPAGGSDSAFCAQAQQFVTQADSVLGQTNDPNLGQTLQQLVTQLQGITPPAAIASDWNTVTSALQQVAAAYQGTNFSDPQQVQQLEQKLAPIEAQLAGAGQHIETYLAQQCGISTSESSAPSS